MSDDELRQKLVIAMVGIGVPKVSRSWLHDAIRHYHRNVPYDDPSDGETPDRYAGEPIADILELLPDIIRALSATKSQPL